MKGGPSGSCSMPFQRVDLRRRQVGLWRFWKAGEQGQQGIKQTSLWPFLAPFLGSVPYTNLGQEAHALFISSQALQASTAQASGAVSIVCFFLGLPRTGTSSLSHEATAPLFLAKQAGA